MSYKTELKLLGTILACVLIGFHIVTGFYLLAEYLKNSGTPYYITTLVVSLLTGLLLYLGVHVIRYFDDKD